MNINFRYNIEQVCRVILHEKISALNIDYRITNSGSVYFPHNICAHKFQELKQELSNYGIEVITDQKSILVQKIKGLITSMITPDSTMPLVKISSFLSDSLNENYRSISQAFTDICHMSIESFIILRKTELVKQLLLNENLSLTEISHRLQYSSVAHLSNQFKNSTGLSPSTFQKIATGKRKAKMLN